MKYVKIKFDNEEFCFDTENTKEIWNKVEQIKYYLGESLEKHIDLDLKITYFDPESYIRELEEKIREKDRIIKALENKDKNIKPCM